MERLLCKDIDGKLVKRLDDLSFYKKQKRIALQNCGKIDPENIEEYIAFDGYKALEKVLFEMSNDEVIEEVKKSGLRGRGGAGFLTGKKWEFTKLAKGDRKYIVCNADEGDPGAFMDRSILEGDPHSVIEAMEIAGYACGADKGYIYVRAEYPIAVQRFNIALKQAREYGILGKNIWETKFSFDIEIRLRSRSFCMWRRNSTFRINRRKSRTSKIETAISCKCRVMAKANPYKQCRNICKYNKNNIKWS